MNVKRYNYGFGLLFETEGDGMYVLHSDYATIEEERDKLAQEIMRLVNMNEQLHERLAAIVEVVAWEREVEELCGIIESRYYYVKEVAPEEEEINDSYNAARAEVDRLLEEK